LIRSYHIIFDDKNNVLHTKGGIVDMQECFRWWRKRDLDGFFGLFIDNLIQLILIVVLCNQVLKMPDELVYGRILPGVAISLLIGNIFYAFQARSLFMRTGQAHVTALPYGVNTISLFAYILFVMKPVIEQTNDAELAWRVGLAACLGSGIIELGGAFIAGWIKRITPRAALLTTLAGIAITFISMDFCFRIFADPLIGFAPIAFIFLQYIGRLRLPAGVPAGLVAVITGTALAWILGRMDSSLLINTMSIHPQPPRPYILELISTIASPYFLVFLPVIVPMGLFNLLGSLQNLESAEAAGDTYPVRSSLAVNGLGTIAAACFGSVFPTTIYIGHPAWKKMGAGAGYSIVNGIVITFFCLLGLVGFVSNLIPVEAGAAILLWIGITITAQAFQATPREHAPAVVIGFFPALAAWGLLILESGLRSTGSNIGTTGLEALSAHLPIAGLISLERGFIFTSMILAALTVSLIEKNYLAAAAWAFTAAAISATGLMHGYKIAEGAIVNAYGPLYTWHFSSGYIGIATIFITLWFWHRMKNNTNETRNVEL
jgi:adenine/guanine/hypoxanthine permease